MAIYISMDIVPNVTYLIAQGVIDREVNAELIWWG